MFTPKVFWWVMRVNVNVEKCAYVITPLSSLTPPPIFLPLPDRHITVNRVKPPRREIHDVLLIVTGQWARNGV